MQSTLSTFSAALQANAPATPLAYGIEAGAEAAGVKRDTIYRAIARGEIAARKIGSRTVILADDLRNWLVSRPPMKRGALEGLPAAQPAEAPRDDPPAKPEHGRWL